MTPPSPRLRGIAAGTGLALAAGAVVLLRRMSAADPGRQLEAPPGEPAMLSRLAGWVPAPPRTRWGRALAYVWASPLTAIGCALGWVSRARPHAQRGVLVFGGAGGLVGAMLRRRGFSATTLGHAVISTAPSPSPALLAHELVHTRQAERLGVLFGPIYVALLGRYGYRQHPFERAARAGASRDTSSTAGGAIT